MKVRELLIGSILYCIAQSAMAASDSGAIVEVYVHPDGQMALMLDKGMINANEQNKCGYQGNPLHQYAGVRVESGNKTVEQLVLEKKIPANY